MTQSTGAGTSKYSLEVSRGYVRLVRSGDRPPRRIVGAKFVRRDGIWVGADAEDETGREVGADLETAGWWADVARPLPEQPEVPDEALRPNRGERGLSARARLHMRRLFVSLPWELAGPRPA